VNVTRSHIAQPVAVTNWEGFREPQRMGVAWARDDRHLRASVLVGGGGELADLHYCAIPQPLPAHAVNRPGEDRSKKDFGLPGRYSNSCNLVYKWEKGLCDRDQSLSPKSSMQIKQLTWLWLETE
jgi:hypothetical protein